VAVLHTNKSNAAGNSKRLYTPALVLNMVDHLHLRISRFPDLKPQGSLLIHYQITTISLKKLYYLSAGLIYLTQWFNSWFKSSNKNHVVLGLCGMSMTHFISNRSFSHSLWATFRVDSQEVVRAPFQIFLKFYSNCHCPIWWTYAKFE